MQSALDAAVLAAASSTATDSATLQTITSSVFSADLPAAVKTSASISSFTYNAASKQIVAKASGSYTTFFGTAVGLSTIPYTATASGQRAAKGTVELALVLDNTYSMSVALDSTGTKMQVLQTAATNLVNALMTSSNAGFVKVAVVPYADYVNVGPTTTGAWLSVQPNYSTTTPATPAVPGGPTVCKTVSTTTQCTGGSMQPYVVSIIDGVVTMGTHMVGQTCATVPITPHQSCSQSPAPVAAKAAVTTNYKWYGCVNNLVSGGLLAPPETASASNPYVGFLTTSQQCLNPILPLTDQPAPVLAAIKGLVYQIGSYKPNTYIAGGITWGVNVLSPTATFASGAPYDAANNKMPRKVIILMTDGFNTNSLNTNGTLSSASFNSDGTIAASSQPKITISNTAEVAACNYAKAKNIEIYAIGFGVTDATSLLNLQQCATDASHYFDAKNSAALIAAFQIIAGNLDNVRIAS